MAKAVRIMAAASTAIVIASLGACSSPDPYCVAVEENQSTLDDFGSESSDAAYAQYATTLETISKVAPAPIDEQWASLTRATQGVVTAQRDVGFALEDMDDEDKREALSEGDIKVLNKAYQRFNGTTSQRKAVVDDVQQTCDIELK